MKYKVQSDTSNQFTGIEIDYVIEDFTIGRELMFLGENYTLKQNGLILVLGNKDRVITIQELKQKEEPLWSKMLRKEDLRINHEVEIYFETKEIQLKNSERLGKNGTSFQALFDLLQAEWKMAGVLSSHPFPLEMREHNNLLFKDEWALAAGSLEFLRKGSFTRVNSDGRTI